MYSTMKTGEKKTPYLVELVVDTDAEIASLPTHYAPGSTCIAISSSTTYMLNHSKQWTVVSTGGGGGSGGDIDVSLATRDQIDAFFEKTVNADLATTDDIDAIFNK